MSFKGLSVKTVVDRFNNTYKHYMSKGMRRHQNHELYLNHSFRSHSTMILVFCELHTCSDILEILTDGICIYFCRTIRALADLFSETV